MKRKKNISLNRKPDDKNCSNFISTEIIQSQSSTFNSFLIDCQDRFLKVQLARSTKVNDFDL